jgi:uncharacterized protein YjbI with pentapeptide repeats
MTTSGLPSKSSDAIEEEKQHEKRAGHYLGSQVPYFQSKRSSINKDLINVNDSNNVIKVIIDQPIELTHKTPPKVSKEEEKSENKNCVKRLGNWIWKNRDFFAKTIGISSIFGLATWWFTYSGQQNDRYIADQKYQQEALNAYITGMSELMLKENLHMKKEELQLRNIARAKTLTTLMLKGLDPWRRDIVIDFLKKDGMIDKQDNPQDNQPKPSMLSEILIPKADLSKADLSKADLTRTNLQGANLQSANLTYALLDGTVFEEANLRNVILDQASTLTQSGSFHPYFQYADLQNASMRSVILPGANFHYANLKDADFRSLEITTIEGEKVPRPKTNLRNSWFLGSNLENAQFQGADLENAKFGQEPSKSADDINRKLSDSQRKRVNKHTILKNANFQGAFLKESYFYGANLEGANFKEADLRRADFERANLRGANFKGADLRGASFKRANLRGANFQGVVTGINSDEFKAKLIKEKAMLCMTRITGKKTNPDEKTKTNQKILLNGNCP